MVPFRSNFHKWNRNSTRGKQTRCEAGEWEARPGWAWRAGRVAVGVGVGRQRGKKYPTDLDKQIEVLIVCSVCGGVLFCLCGEIKAILMLKQSSIKKIFYKPHPRENLNSDFFKKIKSITYDDKQVDSFNGTIIGVFSSKMIELFLQGRNIISFQKNKSKSQGVYVCVCVCVWCARV